MRSGSGNWIREYCVSCHPAEVGEGLESSLPVGYLYPVSMARQVIPMPMRFCLYMSDARDYARTVPSILDGSGPVLLFGLICDPLPGG